MESITVLSKHPFYITLLAFLCTISRAHAQPEFVLPVGHTDPIHAVVYSPDGKYILTASADYTAILWDVTTGKMLHQLKRHTGAVVTAQFSADGKYIATGSADSTVLIWDALTGNLLQQLKGHDRSVESVLFIPGSQTLVVLSSSRLFYWDYISNHLQAVIKDDFINLMRLSPDGKELLTGGHDFVCIRDAITGKILHRLNKNDERGVMNIGYSKTGRYITATFYNQTGIIWERPANKVVYKITSGSREIPYGIYFSPNDEYFIIPFWNHTIEVYKTSDFSLLYKLDLSQSTVKTIAFNRDSKTFATASDNGNAIVWETATGKQLHRFEIGLIAFARLQPPLFSPDGNNLVLPYLNGVKIIELSTWKTKLDMKGHTSGMFMQFSNDGKTLISGASDGVVTQWTSPTGEMVRQPVIKDAAHTIVLNPNGNSFATVLRNEKSICLFDYQTNKLLTRLEEMPSYPIDIEFSPDGNHIACASSGFDSKLFVWETQTGKRVQQITVNTESINELIFSPDNNKIITGNSDNTAVIWDVKTGRRLLTLKGHTGKVNNLACSPDGKTILTAGFDNAVIVWDSETGQIIRRFNVKKSFIRSVFYSRDGKYIIASTNQQPLIVWRSTTGEKLMEVNNPPMAREYQFFMCNINNIDPSGQYFIVPANNNILIYEMETGRVHQKLTGHNNDVFFGSYSHDGKYIVSGSNDDVQKFWDATSGRLLYSLIKVDTSDYLVVDKDGRYDGSEAARKLLYYTCGNEIIDLDQFKDLCWEPGLVSKLTGLNKEPIKAKALSEIDICNRTPRVENVGTQNNTYNFSITPQKGGIGDVDMFVNGKQVKSYTPSQLSKNGNNYNLTVNTNELKDYLLPGQENNITIKASTADGTLKSRGASKDVAGNDSNSSAPYVYAIAVGISQYKSAPLKLGYASKDATDFSAALLKSSRKLFNIDGKEHVQLFIHNTEAGNNNAFKKDIQKSFATIAAKAKAGDILVIFMAGHGVLNSDKKQFYYLTADASALDITGVEKEVAISTEELDEWMRSIKAQKQLLILDACNSGKAVANIEELSAKREIPSDQRRALERLKDRTGTFMLTASAANQAAYETSLYGQGLLTYSLLYGIKGGNGLRDNKFLDVTKWFNAAADQVKQMAKDFGGRQEPQLMGKASFDVGIVDKDVSDGIRLTLKKVFGRSEFQNDKFPKDNLGFGVLINKQLTDISARGSESPLAYLPDNTLPESYSIGGKYTVNGNMVLVKVSLFKGADKELYHFEQTGTIDKLEALAVQVMRKINSFRL